MDRALVQSVLQLDPEERVDLMDAIYQSLGHPDGMIDEAWYDEAERRLAAYKAGDVRGVPVEHVLGDRP